MSSFLRALALYLFAAALIWAAFSFHKPAHAAEYFEAPHFAVGILACASDGHCEHFRRALDVDTMMQCQMRAMFGATQWGVEHPGWTLKEWHCLKEGEQDL